MLLFGAFQVDCDCFGFETPQASFWLCFFLCDAPECWIKCPLQVVNAPSNTVCTGVTVAASLRRCRHLQCEQALPFFSHPTFPPLQQRFLNFPDGCAVFFHMSNLRRSVLFLAMALPFHYNKQYPRRFPSTGKMDTLA